MKTQPKNQRRSRLTTFSLIFCSTLLTGSVLLFVPAKLHGGPGLPIFLLTSVADLTEDGDTSNLYEMKFLNHLRPEVPMEADFDDFNSAESTNFTYFEPRVPAKADFEDTCEVIRHINTERGSTCCSASKGLSNNCL